MWESCKQKYPLKFNESEFKENVETVNKVLANDTVAQTLNFILQVIGLTSGLSAIISEGILTLAQLSNPEFKLPEEWALFGNGWIAINRVISAGAINFVELDKKIKAINPQSNFIDAILHLKFNGNFDDFERDMDVIFNQETLKYTSLDYLSLLCVVADLYIMVRGKETIIKEPVNMAILNAIGPRKVKTDDQGKLVYTSFDDVYKNKVTNTTMTAAQLTNIWTNANRELKENIYVNGKKLTEYQNPNAMLASSSKGEYKVDIQLGPNIPKYLDTSKLDPEIAKKLGNIQKSYDNMYYDKNLDRIVSEMYTAKYDKKIDEKWRIYEQNNTLDKTKLSKLRNDNLQHDEIDNLKDTMLSSTANFVDRKLYFAPSKDIHSTLVNNYNPLLPNINTDPNKKLIQDELKFDDPNETNNVLKYMEYQEQYNRVDKQLQDQYVQYKMKEKEISNFLANNIGFNPNQPNQDLNLVNQYNQLITAKNYYLQQGGVNKEILKDIDLKKKAYEVQIKNRKIIDRYGGDNVVTTGNYTDPNKNATSDPKKQIEYLQYLQEVDNKRTAEQRTNSYEGKREIVNDLMSMFNPEEEMKKAYTQHYMGKDVKFLRNVDIAVVLGYFWSMYPTMKTIFQLYNMVFKDAWKVYFTPDGFRRFTEEIVGVAAGVLLGTDYLKKNVMYKLPKEIKIKEKISEQKDEVVDQLIQELITHSKEPYKKYEDVGKKETKQPELNVLIDKSDELETKQKLIEERKELLAKIKNPVRIEVTKDHRERLVKSMLVHTSKIKQSKKVRNTIVKDNFVAGSMTGMIANNNLKIETAMTTKDKIHKFLCQLLHNSQYVGELMSRGLTSHFAFYYVMNKLAVYSLGFYKQYRTTVKLDTYEDMCSYASATGRTGILMNKAKTDPYIPVKGGKKDE